MKCKCAYFFEKQAYKGHGNDHSHSGMIILSKNENDHFLKSGNDHFHKSDYVHFLTSGNDHFLKIGNDHFLKMGNDHFFKIGNDHFSVLYKVAFMEEFAHLHFISQMVHTISYA